MSYQSSRLATSWLRTIGRAQFKRSARLCMPRALSYSTLRPAVEHRTSALRSLRSVPLKFKAAKFSIPFLHSLILVILFRHLLQSSLESMMAWSLMHLRLKMYFQTSFTFSAMTARYLSHKMHPLIYLFSNSQPAPMVIRGPISVSLILRFWLVEHLQGMKRLTAN